MSEMNFFDGDGKYRKPSKGDESKKSETVETPPDPNAPPFSFEISAEEKKRTVYGGTEAAYTVNVINRGRKSDTIKIRMNTLFSAQMGAEAPEWPIMIEGPQKEEEKEEYRLSVHPGEAKKMVINVHVPHGVKYGDKVEIVVTATSEGDSLVTESLTIITAAQQSFFVVKTTHGQEWDVVDAIAARAGRADVAVFSVLSPTKNWGYIFVEAMNRDRLKEIVRGIRKARGLVEKDSMLSFEEINPYLTPRPLVSGIKEGDIVELISGPFKGEKARVQHIDEGKEEITVELFEAMVPIPLTIKGDSVRVLEKEADM